jgi:WbqC-like protein
VVPAGLDSGSRVGGDKIVAIVQSNYIPWKGYFDLINSVDEFILYDTMQYTRRDWRNRNLIKTRDGLRWLTIAVQVKGRYSQTIQETRISDPGWSRRHLETIRHCYRRAPFFDQYESFLIELYRDCSNVLLSEVNERFLRAICQLLGMRTMISRASSYSRVPGRHEQLMALLLESGARRYLSGPTARGYLDEARFEAAGVRIEWMDYSDYPEYPQLFPPFEHRVSVIDLLLNVGPAAPRFMKSFRTPSEAGPPILLQSEDRNPESPV